MPSEKKRLEEDRFKKKNWKRWGPYLSEREWATVREDYSPKGDSWDYFPHSQARSRAYRWGEDGLLGLTDRECRVCFALALWNGKDPILKERAFGLTEKEGNHGEDVKECYYYLDSTPTHSYMKALYKYPQAEFPYQQLLDENRKRGLNDKEFELTDTHLFEHGKYFDVFIEYGKNNTDDLLIRVTCSNRSLEKASLDLVPTLWFRNVWTWDNGQKPELRQINPTLVELTHETLGKFYFACETKPEEILFTENETNNKKLFDSENQSPYVKDGFHEYIIEKRKEGVNPERKGTKCAPLYHLEFQGNETKVFNFRFVSEAQKPLNFFGHFDRIFEKRIKEADAFYETVIDQKLSEESKMIVRQAYAGLLWTKQFYHYIVKEWFEGDQNLPKPPSERFLGRNKEWHHVYAKDVISVPDKWEYPWFAAWDLAFHMIPFAKIDPEFAKRQMILFLREWYMHPNGQQPAYEYGFSDVNPPVHAWGCWRIYKISGKKGERDIAFLESVFQKLLMNFTWWLNRKDLEGNNIFGGGFLGLDNIGVFNRSSIKAGTSLEQADGTAWMAFYCLNMLGMALELSMHNPVYEDIASKFFEHFLRVADAINQCGGLGLWNEDDGFYYDILKVDSKRIPLKTRSLVGLIPIIAVEILEEDHIKKLEGFKKRMRWFLEHRKDLEDVITYCKIKSEHGHRILAISSKERLKRILAYVFDENEFLSPFGIRSLSKVHGKNPFVIHFDNEEHRVEYAPGEARSYLFGGNSNWRGPIWFPINFLIIEALERYHHFYGDTFLVEYPSGSGNKKNLKEIADDLTERLTSIFMKNKEGSRPCHGKEDIYRKDPYWQDLILFYEYFHGENGRGLGASHQTGWTSLITKLFEI